MARDPDKAVLRVVDESPPRPEEVVRLTSHEGAVIRSAPVPLVAPLSRLEPEERSTEERRTHEPDYESLAESTEAAARPLEETWNDEEIRSRPVPWGWFAIMALVGVGAVTWSVTNLVGNRQSPETARTKAITTLDNEEREKQEAEATVDRIMDCVRTYCQSGTIDSLLAVSRQPDRVRPLMEQWYRSHPFNGAKFDSLDLLQPMTLENRGSFWMVSCSMEDGSKRHLLLEETEDKKVQVDWESEVCYQPMEWDAYCKDRPEGSLDFRVRVLEDNYFSHEFSDSTKWACFQLSALRSDQVMFGYVDRQSETGQQLVKLQQMNHGRQISVILRLSKPTDLKSPRGLVIERLMSPRWTYVEPPDA